MITASLCRKLNIETESCLETKKSQKVIGYLKLISYKPLVLKKLLADRYIIWIFVENREDNFFMWYAK